MLHVHRIIGMYEVSLDTEAITSPECANCVGLTVSKKRTTLFGCGFDQYRSIHVSNTVATADLHPQETESD